MAQKYWRKSHTYNVDEIDTWSQSYQTFIFVKRIFFPFFAIELDRLIVNALFSNVTNTQLNNENRKIKKIKDW